MAGDANRGEEGYAAWRARVERLLDGAGPEVLAAETFEGLRVEPVYPAEPVGDEALGRPGVAPFRRGSTAAADPFRPWWLTVPVAVPDVAAARAEVAEALDGGADALGLRIEDAGWAPDDLAGLLDGVLLDAVALHLDAGPAGPACVDALLADLPADSAADGAGWSLGLDPLRADPEAAAAAAARAAERLPAARPWIADAVPFHEAGGDAAEELALALGLLAAARRRLAARVAPDALLAGAVVRLAGERDLALGVAKLRAARLLLSRLAVSWDVPPAPPFLHAVTSPRVLTRRDAQDDLLRITTQAWAAVVGGADAVTTATHEDASGAPSAEARRLARNVQHVLRHEGFLGETRDPLGGSPFLETLTDDLAAEAWRRFEEREADGGLEAALASGALRHALDRQWERRRFALRRRHELVVGHNLHPRLEQRLVARPPARRAPAPFDLPRRRDAEEFEALRDRADALAEAGRAPRALVVHLAPPRGHRDLTLALREFLTIGGIALAEAEGAAGLAAAVAAERPAFVAALPADAPPAERAELAERCAELGLPLEDLADHLRPGEDVVARLSGLLDLAAAAEEARS